MGFFLFLIIFIVFFLKGKTSGEFVPIVFEYKIDLSKILQNILQASLAVASIVYLYSFLKSQGGGLANRTNDVFNIGFF